MVISGVCDVHLVKSELVCFKFRWYRETVFLPLDSKCFILLLRARQFSFARAHWKHCVSYFLQYCFSRRAAIRIRWAFWYLHCYFSSDMTVRLFRRQPEQWGKEGKVRTEGWLLWKDHRKIADSLAFTLQLEDLKLFFFFLTCFGLLDKYSCYACLILEKSIDLYF